MIRTQPRSAGRPLLMAALAASVFLLVPGRTGAQDPSPTSGPGGPPIPVLIGGIEFVPIPSGEFLMGDATGDGDPDERPRHRVGLDAFLMGRSAVTLAQWKIYLKASGFRPAGGWHGSEEDHPVTGVTWDDAVAFCRWFSTTHSVKADLPTEAQWEYAARGGLEGKRYPNGDSITRRLANYYSGGTSVPGKYPPNGYGLYDMAGNVYEWCADWYDPRYYGSSPGKNPPGPATGTHRVLRGGSWRYAGFVRVSERMRDLPSLSYDAVGFRIVAVPGE